MSKKQSTEKREIIQNGLSSMPLGFLAGGPVGAIAVAGLTAVLAAAEEKEDQKLREKEWERKHPKCPTFEERMEVEKNNDKIIADIYELMKNKVYFPYRCYSIDRKDCGKHIPFRLAKGQKIDVSIGICNEKNPFCSYEKVFNGTIYSKEDFLDLLKWDSKSEFFEPYSINKHFSYLQLYNMYTLDGYNYIICG